MIEVKIDDTQITRALQELQQAAGDLSPAFREIAEVLIESTKQRFSDGSGPDGQPWADNAPVTVERKGRNKPLVDGGNLQQQFAKNIIGGHTLEIFNTLEYAAMQQFGGTKAEFPHLWGDIPARPFMGLSGEDEDAVLTIIRDHLQQAI